MALLVFLSSSYSYYQSRATFLFKYENKLTNKDEFYVKGDQIGMREEMKRLKHYRESINEDYSDLGLSTGTGEPSNDNSIAKVWTEESIAIGKARLTLNYILFVASLGCAIFSLASLLETNHKLED